MPSPQNLHEARKEAGYTSVEALRDAILTRCNLPTEAVPSMSTWNRVDRDSKRGVDPATKGLDALLCMWVAELCGVSYDVVSPVAARLADPARDLLMRKMRCSSLGS